MRDKSLDIIKGLACILMIFAHSKTLGRTIDNSFTEPFWYLGFFAPILFFASVGVSLTYQLNKRSLLVIIIFNLLLFIISFADRGRESVHYLNITSPNLIGSLALASIFAVLFRRINGLIFLICLLILDRIANKFALTPTIFYGLLFALIPWGGITTLGRFLQQYKNLRLYIIAAGCLITFYYFVIKNQTIENQFLTSLFLGMSLMIYGLVAVFSGKITKIPGISQLLIYLGKNTLLFYWIHLFILFTISFKLPAPLMWIFVLVVSLLAMVILKGVNKYSFERFSKSVWFWIMMVITVFLPLLLNPGLGFQFYFFSALTILFALNYHQFFKLKFIEDLNK